MKYIILTIIALAFLLSSCTHYYYMPNTLNVPLFKEKKEFTATINCGANGLYSQNVNTLEIQSACSISNHVGLMANFMSANGSSESEDGTANGIYGEGGLGYFNQSGNYTVYEIFGGVGFSNQHHQYAASYPYNLNPQSELSFTRFFLQPSVGWTFRAFDIALSGRFCTVSFYNIDHNLPIDSYNNSIISDIDKNKTSSLFEPAITVRGGWKYIKFQFQLVQSFNINHPNLKFEDIGVSAGVSIHFADRYRHDTIQKDKEPYDKWKDLRNKSERRSGNDK